MTSNNLIALKLKKPLVGSWFANWQSKYERTFNFEQPAERLAFCQGISEMADHLTHASRQASLQTVYDEKGINTLYVSAKPLSD